LRGKFGHLKKCARNRDDLTHVTIWQIEQAGRSSLTGDTTDVPAGPSYFLHPNLIDNVGNQSKASRTHV
jgi:hypothetical protein